MRQVRYAVQIEGLSQREAARRFGIDPRTVAKMLAFSVPPGYRRSEAAGAAEAGPVHRDHRPDPGGGQGRPTKQRHTAKRIFERLRDEHGFTRRLHDREGLRARAGGSGSAEMFVPLRASAGPCAGRLRRGDGGDRRGRAEDPLLRVGPAALATPASCRPIRRRRPRRSATATSRRSPSSAACRSRSSTTTPRSRWRGSWATARASGRACSASCSRTTCSRTGSAGPARATTRARSRAGRLCPAQLPGADAACRRASRSSTRICWSAAASGMRRSAARPRRDDRRAAGARSGGVASAAAGRPTTPARRRPGRVSSLSLVRYRSNDYSVPTAYGHREVLVRGYVDEVVIACGGEIIARHPRSYEREDFVFDPLHYLALLEQKIGALDQAAPLAGWDLPEEFATLRRLLEARMGKPGKREFVQVLRLLESVPDRRRGRRGAATRIARGAIGFDAVKHLVLCRIERRPPRLDLTVYPYLPRATVATTSARTLHGPARRGWRHDRHAPAPARPSPQGAEAADVPARVRQARPAVRRRGRRPSPLPAAPGRAGADRARAADGRAADQGGAVPGGQKPRQLRLHGDPVAQQDAGAGAGPLRVHRAPRERHRARQQRHRQDAMSPSGLGWPPARRASRSASPPRPPWSTS